MPTLTIHRSQGWDDSLRLSRRDKCAFPKQNLYAHLLPRPGYTPGSPRRLTMTTKIVKLRTLLAFLVPILYAIRVWRMGENSLNGHVIYKLIHAVRLLPYSWLSFVDTGGCTGCILQYFDYDPGPLEEGRRTSLSSSSDW